jgi:hypothetical protein
VTYVAWKYHRISNARNYIIAVPVLTGIVGVLSAVSITNVGPCPDNPTESCSYNDSVPFMAGVVGVFLLVSLVKTMMLYGDR